MVEEGVTDHQSAKTKAIARLGLPANAALPDNREIEHALVDHLELFDARELSQRRKQWRQTALEAMQIFAEFSPFAIGAVVSGTITRYSTVQLLLVASPETISILLQDMDIPFDQAERRFRRSTRDTVFLPSFQFVVDDVRVELVCVNSDAMSRSLLCPITGKPFRRADTRKLQRMIAPD